MEPRHVGGVLGTRKTISRTNSDVVEAASHHPRHRHKAGRPPSLSHIQPQHEPAEYTGAPFAPLPRGLISRLSMLELSRLSAPLAAQQLGGVSGGAGGGGGYCHPGIKLRRTRSASSIDSVPSVPLTEHAMIEAALERLASRSTSPAGGHARGGTSTVGSSATSSPVSSHASSLYYRRTHAHAPAASHRPPSSGALSSSGDLSSSASLASAAPARAPAAATEPAAARTRGTPFDALLQHELIQPLVQRVPETWRGPLGEAGATAWAAASNPISTARSTSAGVSAWAAATAAAGATSAVTRAYDMAPSAPQAWKRNVLEWLEERPRLAGIGRHLDEWHQTIEKLSAEHRARQLAQRQSAPAPASAASDPTDEPAHAHRRRFCTRNGGVAEPSAREEPLARETTPSVTAAEERALSVTAAQERATREREAASPDGQRKPGHNSANKQHAPTASKLSPRVSAGGQPKPHKQPQPHPSVGAVDKGQSSRAEPSSPSIVTADEDSPNRQRSSPETVSMDCDGEELGTDKLAEPAAGRPEAGAGAHALAPTPRTVPTAFSWFGECHACFLSGTFNKWAERIPLDNGGPNRRAEWSVVLSLPPGEYAYKYIVEQPAGVLRWETSPHEPLILSDGTKVSSADQHALAMAPAAISNAVVVLDQAEHDDGPEASVAADIGALAALAIVPDDDDGYSQELPSELFETVFASANPPTIPRHLVHYAAELRLGKPPERRVPASPVASVPTSTAQPGGTLPAPLPANLAGLGLRHGGPPSSAEPHADADDAAAYGGTHSHASLGHLGWSYTPGQGSAAGGVVVLTSKRRVRNRFITLEIIKPAP